ncbi:hypothetical protein [Micromonospora tarensis]|uniref:Uncharacterized protein n=1 Tax=Micromonospora tarensis TaxID=2806100 RepID=A0ABS1Y9G7_9ACTN|nr:hypothetical protein [Micromonospora tarensis]MBM0274042.1 hypothetical protein [Micromonospora tarensis]
MPISTADTIIAFGSLVRRAHASGDTATFFAARPALRRLMPHFQAARNATRPHLPTGMANSLDGSLAALTHAVTGPC